MLKSVLDTAECGSCRHLLANGGICPRFNTTAEKRTVICHYYFANFEWKANAK